VAVEQIAELEVFAEHIEALVTAKASQLRGMRAGGHAGAEGAALQANSLAGNPAAVARTWMIRAMDRAVRDSSPIQGRGGGVSRAAALGTQRRRNAGPSLIAAVSSQAERARTGQSSVLP
jgi:hypothetical protein